MQIKKGMRFQGDRARAITLLKQILMSANFLVTQKDSFEVEITGSGISSTRQNALLAITHGVICIDHETISFQGELGILKKMKWFIYLFPISLGVLLASIMTIVFWQNQAAVRVSIYVVLGTTLPWLVISPLMVGIMGRMLKNKAENAIETLLTNVASNA